MLFIPLLIFKYRYKPNVIPAGLLANHLLLSHCCLRIFVIFFPKKLRKNGHQFPPFHQAKHFWPASQQRLVTRAASPPWHVPQFIIFKALKARLRRRPFHIFGFFGGWEISPQRNPTKNRHYCKSCKMLKVYLFGRQEADDYKQKMQNQWVRRLL